MKHKCIDIMDVKSFPEYDMLYSDLPWEDRMVKWFETQLRKDTGKEVKNTINGILTQVAKLADTNKPVFLEYSVKGTERVIDIMEKNGHRHQQTIKGFYNKNKPLHIITFNNNVTIPNGLEGGTLIKKCINSINQKVVFDCFAGIGFTCKWVKQTGADYIGYELNPKRFEKMIKVYDRT